MTQDCTLRLLKTVATESHIEYHRTRLSLSSTGATIMQGFTLQLLKLGLLKALLNTFGLA
jgi:hypothetical protein